jgi:DNA-binding FadR family transcriptional regulator
MAAERATRDEVGEIEKAFCEMEQSVGQTVAPVEEDLPFHLAILSRLTIHLGDHLSR